MLRAAHSALFGDNATVRTGRQVRAAPSTLRVCGTQAHHAQILEPAGIKQPLLPADSPLSSPWKSNPFSFQAVTAVPMSRSSSTPAPAPARCRPYLRSEAVKGTPMLNRHALPSGTELISQQQQQQSRDDSDVRHGLISPVAISLTHTPFNRSSSEGSSLTVQASDMYARDENAVRPSSNAPHMSAARPLSFFTPVRTQGVGIR